MKYFIIIIIMIILSVALLSNLRSGTDDYTKFSFFYIATTILSEQGSSVAIIGYYKDYNISNAIHLPFIFGIFHNLYLLLFDNNLYHLMRTNAEYALNSSIVGQNIGAHTNPLLYDEGAGIGGNYIVEEYDIFGFVGVFFLTAIYVYFVYKIQEILKYSNNIFIKTLIFVFLYMALFMPRTQYFTIGLTQFLSVLISYLFYFSFKNYIKNMR